MEEIMKAEEETAEEVKKYYKDADPSADKVSPSGASTETLHEDKNLKKNKNKKKKRKRSLSSLDQHQQQEEESGSKKSEAVDWENMGRLPVYKPVAVEEAENKQELMEFYHGDLRQKQQEKLDKGMEEIRDRTRKRKYLANIVEKKLEKHVETTLYQDKQILDTKQEIASAAERKLAQARSELLREAEAAVLEQERVRRLRAKQKAMKTMERLKRRRLFKRLLGFLLLTASIVLYFSSATFGLLVTNRFRHRIADLVGLYSPSSLWLACDDIGGSLPDYIEDQDSCSDRETPIMEYYLYNMTNVDDYLAGLAKPIVDEVGPFRFKIGARKELVRDANAFGYVKVKRQEYYEYVGDPQALDEKIVTVNMGYQRFLAILQSDFQYNGDQDVGLVAWILTFILNTKVKDVMSGNVTEWIRQHNGGPSCFTFGCYLFQNKFDTIAGVHANNTARKNYYASNINELPVFGQFEWTETQAKNVWEVLDDVTAQFLPNVNNPDRPVECYLPSTDACDKLGPSVSNSKLLIDVFLDLWTIARAGQTILTTVDLVRLDNGFTTGDLQQFYDGIWTRDFRCESLTEFMGFLKCTQLNDLVQYFHWLIKQEMDETIFNKRKTVAMGMFTAQHTIREHLLTGFEDGYLNIWNYGPNASNVMDIANDRIYEDLLTTRSDELLNDTDKRWLESAWVSPILNIPSKEGLDILFINDNQEILYPNTFFRKLSTTSDEKPFSLEMRTYLDGSMNSLPRKSDGARYMAVLNGSISSNLYGEVAPTQGIDGFQFGATLDLFWDGQRYDTEGEPYSTDLSANMWRSKLEVWFDMVHRTQTYVRQEQHFVTFDIDNHNKVNLYSKEVDTDFHVDLKMLLYKYRYDRIQRLEADEGTTTCMVSLRNKYHGMAVYAGYPSYLTCNRTHGDTPLTRQQANNQYLTDINNFNGLFGETNTVKDEESAAVEDPLPLDERATIRYSSAKLNDNYTMNLLALEPVTGTVFHWNRATGIYVDLVVAPYLYPKLTSLTKFPYYTVYESFTRDARQADALGSSINTEVRNVLATEWTVKLISFIMAPIGFLILLRERRRPELDEAKVIPLDRLEHFAESKCDELLEPMRANLEKRKQDFEEALVQYEQAKAQLIEEKSEDASKLILEDVQKVNRNHTAHAQQKQQRNHCKEVFFGISRRGSIFKFTDQELETLLTAFGNPLAQPGA